MTDGHTDNDIPEPYFRRYTAADADHQPESDGWKGANHIGCNGCSRNNADLALGQTCGQDAAHSRRVRCWSITATTASCMKRRAVSPQGCVGLSYSLTDWVVKAPNFNLNRHLIIDNHRMHSHQHTHHGDVLAHSRTHNAYIVGWVCALPKEQTAAIAMLDERHPNLSKPPNNPNSYTLGSIVQLDSIY